MEDQGLKICILNSNFPPNKGGIATFGADLARRLAESPSVAKVAVVAFNNAAPRFEQAGKLTIHTYPRVGLVKMSVLTFWEIFKRRNFDIFHATTIFPVGGLAVLFAKLLWKKKVFITVYGTDVLTREGSAKTRWLKRKIMIFCKKVIAFSKSTSVLASQTNDVPQQKIMVIYPGVDTKYSLADGAQNMRDRLGIKAEDFVVLTACRLVKRKGVDDIIRALGCLSDPKVKLLIVGGGEEEDNLRRLVDVLQLSSRVVFSGAVSWEHIADYYRSANVFVLASKFLEEKGDIEGLGIVLLEAQYFGLPVIGTNSGGVPEAINEGQSGFIVKEGDSRAIAARILELKNNSELYKKMSQGAKDFVREFFSWDGSIQKHIELYISG